MYRYSIETATGCLFENGALNLDTLATLRSTRPIKRAQKQAKRICVTKVVSDSRLRAGSVRLQTLRQSVRPLQLAESEAPAMFSRVTWDP